MANIVQALVVLVAVVVSSGFGLYPFFENHHVLSYAPERVIQQLRGSSIIVVLCCSRVSSRLSGAWFWLLGGCN